MSFFRKIFFFSAFVLLASYLIYKSLDRDKYEDYILQVSSKILEILFDIDSFLRYVHLPGFYRRVETSLGHLVFSMANKSNLNVEQKLFNGVEVILFDPIKHEKNRPAIVYVHGGGWSILSPKLYSLFTSDLARKLNTLIVSVNYRKAPEHPYPAAFDDVLKATKYFLINAERFDVNPSRVGLMGDSAGGNLVLAVGYNLYAQKKKQKNIRVPKVLIPLNPTFQMANMNTPSFRDNVQDPICNRDKMMRFTCYYAFGQLSRSEMDICKDTMKTNGHLSVESQKYVKDNVDWTRYLTGRGYDNRPKTVYIHKINRFSKRLTKLVLDPAFSPLSALNNTDIALLPPVYLLGASKDPLRDDAKILAARLQQVGHIGHYKEFNYYHVAFLFASVKMPRGIEAFNEIINIFVRNAIL